MEFEALDRLGVEEGDEVILEVPSRRLSLTYLMVFGLPVVAMAVAFFMVTAIFALAGSTGGEGAGIVAAVIVGFGVFWAGVKLSDRRGLRPVIREIVKVRGGSDRAEDEDGDFTGRVL